MSPILNGPYSEPLLHYATGLDGSLNYDQKLNGRRTFAPVTPQIPVGTQKQGSMFDINDLARRYDDHLVNVLRKQVGLWRKEGYPDVTSRVTRDLLTHWFLDPERVDHKKLFFAQQETVETAIWLNEVAHKSNVGTHVLNLLRQGNESVEDAASVLPRIAFKMATGSGKTVVMACLLLYHFLNRATYKNDTRYADYFLIVAPGITIRDRLGVLRVDTQATSDSQASDYYRERQLVPSHYAALLPNLNSKLNITNFHSFEAKLISGNKRSPMDGKLGADGKKQEARETSAQMLKRVLAGFKTGRRLLVINDEAHHCYLPKAKGVDNDEENSATENARAAVWFSGIREIAKHYQVRAVYDLSATPYFLSGSGWQAYSLFPWVVSDFSLIDAIESGLVKIPFLPVDDSSQELDEPKLRNLYEHCKEQGLAKRGQRTTRKDAKASTDIALRTGAGAEAPPALPPILTTALHQFYRHYEQYSQGLREQGEKTKDLLTTPPVFIIVCSNTTVSKEVYKWIAGYETLDGEGTAQTVQGLLPLFSNFESTTLSRKRKPPTLLIDSDALENSGQVSDDFKRVFAPEIEAFKREYRIQRPDQSVDALTDGNLLREVVNTVGRPGKLGEHIRCVVSVGMLTEGWDANTVTHIVGVRAFGSQLLCEQVAGRALRRRHYFLDKKTGLFPPEYAHIIGVPFKLFKGGETVTPPPQDVKQLRALPERAELTIEFPNLVGYKIAPSNAPLAADFSALPDYRVDMNDRPSKTTLGSAFTQHEEVLETNIDVLRDQEVIYWAAKEVLSQFFRDEASSLPQLDKFNDIKRIAAWWYEHKIEVVGEVDNRFKRFIRDDDPKAIARQIYNGIEAAMLGQHLGAGAVAGKEPLLDCIVPLLSRYNPKGSSAYVHAMTVKNVYPTKKSHVNVVVADTDSWEQIAAKTLEQLDAVRSYVKNAFLGFHIPYVDGKGKERQYLPDFICRVQTPEGVVFNLILEITGYATDKEFKRYYTLQRWLPAVNRFNQKWGGPEWHFLEVTDIERIKNELVAAIDCISAQIDEASERQFWLSAQASSLSSVWGEHDDELFTA